MLENENKSTRKPICLFAPGNWTRCSGWNRAPIRGWNISSMALERELLRPEWSRTHLGRRAHTSSLAALIIHPIGVVRVGSPDTSFRTIPRRRQDTALFRRTTSQILELRSYAYVRKQRRTCKARSQGARSLRHLRRAPHESISTSFDNWSQASVLAILLGELIRWFHIRRPGHDVCVRLVAPISPKRY